jgi:hypothetical protein
MIISIDFSIFEQNLAWCNSFRKMRRKTLHKKGELMKRAIITPTGISSLTPEARYCPFWATLRQTHDNLQITYPLYFNLSPA